MTRAQTFAESSIAVGVVAETPRSEMANYLQEASDKFYYINSCELNIPFRVKMYVRNNIIILDLYIYIYVYTCIDSYTRLRL